MIGNRPPTSRLRSRTVASQKRESRWDGRPAIPDEPLVFSPIARAAQYRSDQRSNSRRGIYRLGENPYQNGIRRCVLAS